MSKEPIVCYYALGAINYKNGYVTSCPQQSDQLHLYKDTKILKPSEIINSENFKKHRKELMSGTWSQGCHLCKEAEEIGAKSMRQDFAIKDDELKHYNHETGEIDFALVKHVELRFSNACNMACLHCSDVYSSGWMSKLKNYVPDKDDWDKKLVQLTRTFHKSSQNEDLSISISIEEMEVIVDDLILNFPNLKRVDFAGGEVLYQKQFFPCLKKLADHPNIKNMGISFHTNFNAKFDPEELARLLKPFKKANISMSLDAGTNIYSYFRTGDWEVLKKNIEKFRSVDNTTIMAIKCTTSVYQIMDLENIFKSFFTLDVDRIDSAIVYTPRYLNPAVLNLYFKDYVYEDIQKTYKIISEENIRRRANMELNSKRRSWNQLENRFTDISSAVTALKDIEKFVLNHQRSESEYNSFIAYIEKTDKIWQRNFNDYMKKYKIINGKLERIRHA
jgi:MoaA/NifB/PqqE/SkfB family radical SAM enzyme